MEELRYVKNLITTGTGTEGSLLIVKKIHDVLIEEVDKNLIPRSEASMYFGPGEIPGSSIDINLESPNSMNVRLVAEGAEIPLDETEFTSINMKPKKYGVGIRITSEMMEDSKWNLLEFNVRRAGKKFAENETKIILELLDTASSTVAGGASITIANIVSAMNNVEDNDYTPTTIIVGNEIAQDLRQIDTFVEANKRGNSEMLDRGFIGTIYGLNVIRFSTNAAPSATNAKYAYIFDNTQTYMIAEKRPISVENFDLPSNDIRAASVTQRISVALRRDSAVSRITTS